MDTPRAKEGERRVTVDPWDIDGWNMLAAEARTAPFALAKPMYERLVSQFPPASKFWLSYCDDLYRSSNLDLEEAVADLIALYDRAVSNAPTSVELWLSYASCMVNILRRPQQTHVNELHVTQVFERALSAAGLDTKADPLWLQYLNFIGSQASSTDTQRRDDLRRIYQRAVRTPMEQLDVFWRKYVDFENEVNAPNGNKDAIRAVLNELQGKNSDARTECRARTGRRQGMSTHNLPVPPRSRSKEISQAQSWRRYIAWEKSNHANVSAVDLHARIVQAYEAALVPLFRYAEFWIEYVGYLNEYVKTLNAKNSRDAAGLNLKGGANSGVTNDKDGTGKGSSTNDKGAGTASSVSKAEIANLEYILNRSLQALSDSVAMHVLSNSVYVRLGKGEKGVAALENLVQKHASPLAYIHLMRATWKHEGRDAARKTFARARKDKRAAHPLVYVAAAMMEFSRSKDNKIPRNVFEFGLKNFPRHAGLTLEFVNWLWGTGDTEYARVILRKVLPDARGSDEEIQRLWERWVELEEIVGDSASVDHVLELWNESGTGRPSGVVHDVLRMARFHGVEGMGEDDMAVIGINKDGIGESGGGSIGSGASTGGGGGPGGNSGNTGGGKRDPRTGRRVDKSGNHNAGKSKDSNKGGGSASGGGGGGLNGPSGIGNRRKGTDRGGDDLMKVAYNLLETLASTMPPITDPLPNEEVMAILQMVAHTPDSFAATPAGRSNAMPPNVGGKKRKGDDMMMGQMGMGMGAGMGGMPGGRMGGGHGQQDVFRARQAAKQSRLR